MLGMIFGRLSSSMTTTDTLQALSDVERRFRHAEATQHLDEETERTRRQFEPFLLSLDWRKALHPLLSVLDRL